MFGTIKSAWYNVFGSGADTGVESLTKAERAESYKKDVREAGSKFAIIALGVKLAQADGNINDKEIESFSAALSLEIDSKELQLLISEAANDSVKAKHYAERIMVFFPANNTMFRNIVESLFKLAVADDFLNKEELVFLRNISQIFCLKEEFFINTVESHMMPPKGSAYKIMSVTKNVAEGELKKIYRNAMQAYHPDKFSAFDNGKKIIAIANRRINVINEAYNTIKKQKKFR